MNILNNLKKNFFSQCFAIQKSELNEGLKHISIRFRNNIK